MLNNPREKPITLDQAIGVGSAMDQGNIPGYGSGQVDHIVIVDNVDATHPLNLDYVIPSNFQRLISARLSFKLRAFRSYVQAVNNASTTTSGGTSHSHTVANHTHTTPSHTHSTPNHSHLLATFNGAPVAGTNNAYTFGPGQNFNLLGDTGLDISTVASGGGSTTPSGGGSTSGSGGGQTSSAESAHTHDVTSNVTLTYGVFEGAVATSVTVKIDGVDITAQLVPVGPYSIDRIELDLRPFMIPARITTGVFHTIALTPSGLGRIHGFLRLQYFVDGQIG